MHLTVLAHTPEWRIGIVILCGGSLYNLTLCGGSSLYNFHFVWGVVCKLSCPRGVACKITVNIIINKKNVLLTKKRSAGVWASVLGGCSWLQPGPDSILVQTLSPRKVRNGKSVDDLSKRRAAAGESVCDTIFGEELLVVCKSKIFHQPIRGIPEEKVLDVAPRSGPPQEVFAESFQEEGFGEGRKSVVELRRSGIAATRLNFGPPVEDSNCGEAASLLN